MNSRQARTKEARGRFATGGDWRIGDRGFVCFDPAAGAHRFRDDDGRGRRVRVAGRRLDAGLFVPRPGAVLRTLLHGSRRRAAVPPDGCVRQHGRLFRGRLPRRRCIPWTSSGRACLRHDRRLCRIWRHLRIEHCDCGDVRQGRAAADARPRLLAGVFNGRDCCGRHAEIADSAVAGHDHLLRSREDLHSRHVRGCRGPGADYHRIQPCRHCRRRAAPTANRASQRAAAMERAS